MKVGVSLFFQNYFKAERPDREVYREDLALADLIEPLGFDSVWVVEHHFTPYTMIPDAVQLLSYFCGRTKRIGFGTMVVVLPWHDPVRVAEQLAMLDIFTGGRDLTLGFGRGAARVEFEGFRIPMGESRERFAEAAEVVRLALTNERFSFKGKYYSIPETSIRPHPARKNLTERFYGAIVSPETGEIMARAGMGMLVIPQKPWTEHRKDYDAYRASCERGGIEAKPPIVVCWVYCTDNEERAREGAVRWMGNYADSVLKHYEYDEPTHFAAAKGYEYHARMAEAARTNAAVFREFFAQTQVFGTPERCVEILHTIRDTMDAAEFVGVFKYGGMPLEEAERSMRLFAREVLPKIQRGG
jgi:alkanesulfonate monooxygenase SsuD/methylene tetrahydromethanopterin reductase-like flavin-dependent oxidoreductase (luciferase family)